MDCVFNRFASLTLFEVTAGELGEGENVRLDVDSFRGRINIQKLH
jgi:hypothetical protein